jgi:hypothetical protein
LERRTVETDTVLLTTGGTLVDGVLLKGDRLNDPFSAFTVVQGGGPSGGYDHVGGHLLGPGGQVINAFGAGDCLASSRRGYGDGLAHALDSAWRAVQGMEGL